MSGSRPALTGSVLTALPGLLALFVAVSTQLIAAPAVLADDPVMDDWLEAFSGDEFLVNTTTFNHQRTPAVSVSETGESIIIWQSQGQTGPRWSVYGQRLDLDSGPLGGEFRLNEITEGPQDSQHIVHRPDGTMTAVWNGREEADGRRLVFKRHFDSQGNPLSGDRRVYVDSGFTQILPRVAATAEGNLAITWSGNSADGDGYGILARFYGPANQSLGQPFVVNQFTTGAQRSSDVATGAQGGPVVITWQSTGQINDGWGIIARCFSSTGEAITDEFAVSQSAEGSQFRPRVAALPDGRFIITWQDNAGQSQYRRVMARVHDADCQPLTDQFQVNQFDTGVQDFPDAGPAGPDHFLVAWQSFDHDDFDTQGIRARRLDADGGFTGEEFPVSQEPEAYQDSPAVQGDTEGGFLVAWESLGQDGSGYGILARQYFRPVAAELEILSEREISVPAGETLVEPLALRLLDQWGQPRAGQTVTLSGPASGPGLVFDNGKTSTGLQTDPDGKVEAGGLVNDQPGQFVVTAAIGDDGPQVAFSIESRGDPATPVPVPGPGTLALIVLLGLMLVAIRRHPGLSAS